MPESCGTANRSSAVGLMSAGLFLVDLFQLHFVRRSPGSKSSGAAFWRCVDLLYTDVTTLRRQCTRL